MLRQQRAGDCARNAADDRSNQKGNDDFTRSTGSVDVVMIFADHWLATLHIVSTIGLSRYVTTY